MLHSRSLLALAAGTALLASSCRERGAADRAPSSAAGGPPVVYTVNYPLAYFAERIGGDLIRVEFPVPSGADPAFWKPDDETLAGYQDADLILLNGARYARWTVPVSLPESRLVNTSKPFADEYIPIEEGIVHSHGPGGEHSHQGVAFTTWVDPRLALRQAREVHAALVALLPGSGPSLDANFQKLEADLVQLDEALSQAVAGYDGQPLLASHPVYHYLARRCGWDLHSLHWEPDQLPDEDQWQQLEAALAERPARWMIWEGPPRQETAQRLASLGIGCVVFEPCGGRPPQDDYLGVMRQNIRNLAAMAP